MREHDTEYETSTIEQVKRSGDGWSFRMSHGWSFWFSDADAPDFTPRVGDEVIQYGRGIGHTVRGLVIRDRVIYYRTADEDRAKFEREQAEYGAKRQREFDEGGRAELDAKYAALPPVFQARIDKFRHNNPEFRVKYEGYEMFCCEEAVKLAHHLGTVEAMEHYASLTRDTSILTDEAKWHEEWGEQKAIDRAAGISEDHSGNTHGAAVALAFWYLKHPENVERMHGALAPLVGSFEYGCVPPDGAL